MDAPVSRVQFDVPKALVVAAPVSMVSSAERVVTTAVSVPISFDGVVAVENGNDAAPSCCTAVDQYGKIELAVAGVVVDERGKSTSRVTIQEADKACHGQGLLLGLTFR